MNAEAAERTKGEEMLFRLKSGELIMIEWVVADLDALRQTGGRYAKGWRVRSISPDQVLAFRVTE